MNAVWRRFLWLFLPWSVVVMGCAALVHHAERVRTDAAARAAESASVEIGAGTLRHVIEFAAGDIAYLAAGRTLAAALAQPDPANLAAVSADFLAFARAKRIYDQIRWIDEHGEEVVRVDFNDGDPVVTPLARLQDKVARYYFRDAMELGPGETYVSPLDLNVENGRIELPHKPMIRLATPVFDRGNRRRGIVIANYLAGGMLERLRAVGAASGRSLMLLNSDGYALASAHPDEDWGFMFGRADSYATRFPGLWQNIAGAGQGQFESPEGRWTFRTVRPLAPGMRSGAWAADGEPASGRRGAADTYLWKVVSWLPAGELAAASQQRLQRTVLLALALLAAGAWGILRLARAQVQRQRADAEVHRLNVDLEHRVAERTRALEREIAERRRSEEALRFTQFAVEHSGEAALWVNPDASFAYVNEAACTLIGYARKELLGLSVPDVAPEYSRARWPQHWQKLRQAGRLTFETPLRRRDGRDVRTEIQTNLVVFDGREFSCAFVRDITERKRIENLTAARLRLQEYAAIHTLGELLIATLDEACALTGSSIGFYHFVAADQQTISLQAWSSRTTREFCKAQGAGRHYDVAEAGVWADAIRERRAVIHNDYAGLPGRKGLPQGHAEVLREIVLPVLRGGLIVALLGVGNKAADYDGDDLATVARLADQAWDIAENRRAAEALARSEARTRALYETMAQGVVYLDAAGGIEAANPAAERILGVARGKLPGRSAMDERWRMVRADGSAFPADQHPVAVALRAGQAVSGVEVGLFHPEENRYRWIVVHAKPLREGDADPVSGVVATFEDITARKSAEAALAESEARFRTLIANVPGAVYRCELNLPWRVSLISQGVAALTGYGAQEFLRSSEPLTWADLVVEADLAGVDAAVAAAVGARAPYEIEYRIVRADGRVRWVREIGRAAYDEHGSALWLDGVIGDITDRKQLEVALKLRGDALETALNGFHILDGEGRFVYANRAYLDMWGYASLGEILATAFAGHCADPDLPVQMLSTLDRLGACTLEFVARRKDGSTFDALMATRVFADDAGRKLYTGSSLDVSERKRVDAQIRRLNESLEARVAERTAALSNAVRELESFTYSASHDLRTPLRGIEGFSALLEEEYRDRLDERARDYLARIRRGAQRMAQLIDDLLELARVSRSAMRPERSDLGAIAKAVAAELQADEPQRAVRVDIAPDLVARADPALMDVLLRNLIGNAWKFTAGVAAAHIRFEREPGSEGDVFVVRDNGVGFDMRYADKLFRPFQRLHGPGEFPGNGIGLATVQRIVQRHGGKVWAQSEPGRGTAVRFTLARGN